jgi:hypothetical protein
MNDFIFMLTQARQLEELTIFDVYFSEKPSADRSIITLRIGGGNTVGRLGPHLDFPSLRRLTMLHAQDTDIENILKIPRLLNDITHFAVTDNGRSITTLSQLFHRLTTVTNLDLSDTMGDPFQQLLVESARSRMDPAMTLFPCLQSITLGDESVENVQNFCILQGAKDDSDGSHMVLKEIIVPKRRRSQVWERLKSEWIARHVTSVVIDTSCKQLYMNHESMLLQYSK